MIPIQDLCVGNWVYDGDRTQFPMYVQTIGEDYVYLNFEDNEGDVFESTPEELQGIPLTDDVLKKSGFERFDRNIWSLDLGYAHVAYTITSGFLTIERYERSRCVSRCTCLDVRFVHELQNLVWNITKQQLKIEL